jgi:16S rRNA (adenine1518-N6/adenine1519-N6)-dimethyltransferase
MTSRRTRALGQHLLVDQRVAERVARYARLSKTDTVLEIGPGKGILTRFLARGAGRVIAVEKDRQFTSFLQSMPANVELLFADALKHPLPDFDKVVSNLPYSISSPVTFLLLERDFELGVLMYQMEFAERMVAPVGSPDYSRLSVEVFRRADCRLLEEVPPSAFAPHPRVRSAIVELRPRPCPFKIIDGGTFSAMARALFSHRRKSVANALRSEERLIGELLRGLDTNDPLLKRRAESLSPEEIAELANSVAGDERREDGEPVNRGAGKPGR